jgi:hypothetical protein
MSGKMNTQENREIDRATEREPTAFGRVSSEELDCPGTWRWVELAVCIAAADAFSVD